MVFTCLVIRIKIFFFFFLTFQFTFKNKGIKLEAMFSNKGVPENKEEALLLSKNNYFEFHVRIQLPVDPAESEQKLCELSELCKNYGAHLSKNALKSDPLRRFVTLREYFLGKIEALNKLNGIVESLEKLGFQPDGILREYSVYDSNVKIDAGWAEPPSVLS